jgi:NAD(P)-dependent dehydrogenase (short-subunit alcohol dehydrogenase family)
MGLKLILRAQAPERLREQAQRSLADGRRLGMDSVELVVSRRVVLTGAGGRIGRAVLPLLPATWDVLGTDLNGSSEVAALDVTDPDACRRVFAGADAVVHLAAVPDPEASWERLLPANVLGPYHVAAAAAGCGVRRLVLASSLHAVSAVPGHTQARATDPPRPANLYGATKAWAEALGSWVAATTPTSVVAVRIGYFAEHRPDPDTVPAKEVSAWLSPRDAAELVRASVEADGITFLVANGISANRYRRADLSETMRQLDYQPVDDVWSPEADLAPLTSESGSRNVRAQR